jgi:hypothetical protein
MLNGRNLTRQLSVDIARLEERPLTSLYGSAVAAALKDIAPPHVRSLPGKSIRLFARRHRKIVFSIPYLIQFLLHSTTLKKKKETSC